tara:strand:- start:1533 stop:1988 length:456 start_codon:yes stop_codon:yes gene_type:complete
MNKFLVYSFVLVISGCSTSYNIPFVGIEETIQLKPNMTKEQVFNILGEPIFVKSGNKVDNEVEWAYEVRYKMIQSNYNLPKPKKRGAVKDLTGPKHLIILVFQNEELIKWYSEETNSKISQKKMFFNDNFARFFWNVIFPLSILSGLAGLS